MHLKSINTFIIFTLLCLFTNGALAQFNWVKIGVDGLTCTQCTRGVELSIRKLDFVKDVEMSLENTEGKITFKPEAKVNIEMIAQAVVDAGFSVRYLNAGFVFQNVVVYNGYCYIDERNHFQFIKIDETSLEGETTLKFIGKAFQSKQEYKYWKGNLITVCDKLLGKLLYVTL